MKCIRVNASRQYNVEIQHGALAIAGEETLKATHAIGKALIVSDETEFPLYGETVAESVRATGYGVHTFVFKGGEDTKSIKTYEAIIAALSENRFTRSDVLVALGGGIVGDVGGFAAATYQRGIKLVQLPTTLLADVDSSVGGKTAVNLPTGKNQLGCFYQPSLVLCDTDALSTLPEAEYKNGCGEIIKYAVLAGGELFSMIENADIRTQYADVIARCVTIKRDIVGEDEFDTGRRRLLNLGHTFGHAIEKCSGYSIPHGAAVGIGLAMMCRAAHKRGYCAADVPEKVEKLLAKYGMSDAADFTAQELYDAALSHKMIAGGSVSLVIPEKIGYAWRAEGWWRAMTRTVKHGARTGGVDIISSKSYAHRLIILASLAKSASNIECRGTSKDIEATISCMNALGANIARTGDTIHIEPITAAPEGVCELHCGESGSTLRFLLPIVGALGAEAVFIMEGRLGERPLAPLDAVLGAHGMAIQKQGARLCCKGRRTPGESAIDGGVSSQYISGLLMALPKLDADSTLTVTGRFESGAYVDITLDTLKAANAAIAYGEDRPHYAIRGGCGYNMPALCRAEGDWSNAAFFLCMGALSRGGITVNGLNAASCQGDRQITAILRQMGADVRTEGESVAVRHNKLMPATVDASPIPDLIPTICALAESAMGDTRIVNAARLRLKESDRLKSTADMLSWLGVGVTELADGLIVHGTGRIAGGTVQSFNDHRIAMAAAVAACAAEGDVSIEGSECVSKSYPAFFTVLDTLNTEGENA